MEEANLLPEPQQAAAIPSRPLVFSACRRIVGASFREFSLKPEVVAQSLIAALAFQGLNLVNNPLSAFRVLHSLFAQQEPSLDWDVAG